MQEAAEEQPLIAAAREGDAAAFAALLERHQQMAFRVAYLLLRDTDSAQDITQDAFLRAHRALDTFRDGEPFRPWLLRIVSNLSKNELRARARRARLRERVTRWLPSQHDGERDDPLALVVGADRREAVRRLLDEVSEADREILLMRYVADLSEAEMAALLEVAPGTVKSRLSRARARLRETIEQAHPWLVPAQSGGGGDDR
ncbi:MAG: RNA polymerase sigma factor [Dehalococcoidia bacterium]|nr:RNA polymerase sigma factor [Dehalococcoidia bacterium]